MIYGISDQNSLSSDAERIIDEMIKTGRFTVAENRISCFLVKRCDYCPLQGSSLSCIDLLRAYALKYFPELLI